MALNVYRPPDPAAGQELAVAVPGQYVYTVLQLAATLTQAGGQNLVGLPIADTSGNGHNGVLVGTYAQSVPGLLAGDSAIDFGAAANAPASGAVGRLPNNALTVGDNWSIVFWWGQTANVNPTNAVEILAGPNAGALVSIGPGVGGDVIRTAVFPFSQITTFATFTFPTDGSAHLIGATCSKTGATFTLTAYADGVADGSTTSTQANHVDPNLSNGLNAVFNAGFPSDPQGAAILQAVALFDHTLSAGDMAALFAAGTDMATYTAAVLALAPTSYYPLDEGSPLTSAAPVLQITDGTHVLGSYPANFTQSTGVGVTYRWVAGTSGLIPVLLNVDVLAQFPVVTLPPGYILQTVTPGLAAGDQWSDVQLWVDQEPSGYGLLDVRYDDRLILG